MGFETNRNNPFTLDVYTSCIKYDEENRQSYGAFTNPKYTFNIKQYDYP